MTICLAANCKDGESPLSIVAADRMVTYGGFIEFEHAVSKMAHPSPMAVVMVAGDTLRGTRIAQDVSSALAGTTPKVVDVARQLAAHYQEVRQQVMESQILVPRGLTLQTFYGAHAALNSQITMMIDQTMAQYNLNVEMLLGGVDPDGAHIFSVHNPGPTELQHDVIGYSAVGSGAIHALQSMIGFNHSSSAGLRETIFRVYASKRRAEVAPGVGHDTDLAIISSTGVRWLSEPDLARLSSLFDDFLKAGASQLDEQLADLDLGEEGDDDADGD